MSTDEARIRADWLLKEYDTCTSLYRMYTLARGTLLGGSFAVMGVLTVTYRESVRAVDFHKLQSSGVTYHIKGFVPAPLAVGVTSLLILSLVAWMIHADSYLGNEQRIVVKRGAILERFMGSSHASFSRLQLLHKKRDVFYLGRGLLILFSVVWVVVYGLGTLNMQP